MLTIITVPTSSSTCYSLPPWLGQPGGPYAVNAALGGPTERELEDCTGALLSPFPSISKSSGHRTEQVIEHRIEVIGAVLPPKPIQFAKLLDVWLEARHLDRA